MSGWPALLWLVRHGESAGNVALRSAELAGSQTIEIEGRDVDVTLSARGQRQARAVGTWLSAQGAELSPSVVLSSPYVRARQTSALLLAQAGLEDRVTLCVDERLREKEFGSLNRLTRTGIALTYPEEARRRADLGKFYYRPPAGESWCDVILRLRSVIDHLQLRYGGERVMIVAHQVVVLCFRYLLEGLDEARLLEIDAQGEVANCSITTFESDPSCKHGGMSLRAYNFTAHLTEAGESVTHEPDPAVHK